MSARVVDFPLWLRDVDATLPVTAQYVVHGNIRDRHLLPPRPGTDRKRLVDTVGALWACLQESDFDLLLHHSPTTGLSLRPPGTQQQAVLDRLVGSHALGRPMSYADLAEVVRRVAGSSESRVALIIDYVSQNRPPGEPPEDDLHRLMLSSLEQVHAGVGHVRPGARRGAIYNPVFWFVDLPGDLPAWMVSGSDGIRQVAIPLPDLDVRSSAATALAPNLPRTGGGPGADAKPDPSEDVVRRFAECTEGMTLRGLMEVVSLANDAAAPVGSVDSKVGHGPSIEASVQAYRLGLLENPWQRPLLRSRIAGGEATLNRQVKGQPRAVRHAVDILVRSSMGLTGAHRNGPGAGPRGVLFFAGPTGVGKTELAKAITTLVFGDERAYIRFDMSEFSARESDARLIGSPPGYTGHGSGGELTNAVRSRPFSLVLFDEIEKAHPRILDKFLQILSDGRLTDGSGGTVHFSETIIVFTSNLGVRDVSPGDTGEGCSFEEQVKANVEREFREQLNRPELLGRIGDNIVVFDYLTPGVAREILKDVLPRVQRRVRTEHGVELVVPDTVASELFDECVRDLTLGGRGVLDAMEQTLVNPLARALIGRGEGAGPDLVATGLARRSGGLEVTF